ncbi:MAG: HindIII family type II restriction endonuclease [Limisphaerales bacterium]
MNLTVLKQSSIERRAKWVAEIKAISGNFGDDTLRLNSALDKELKADGLVPLLDHLRLCGAIPESFDHDSSEEKLYSKYTDMLLAEAFKFIGLTSLVLTERADSADVECSGTKGFCFVGDAKAFRLSRTAKNQKDFKIQAMDGWKRGKPYAMVVCPIYQLPARASQIYQQASARNVCIFTYSHLCLLIAFSKIAGGEKAQELLLELFKIVRALQPSKDANSYWLPLNRKMLEFSKQISELWKTEKMAALESIEIVKDEALTHLAAERMRIAQMSRDEAIQELIREHNIENRMAVINNVADNGIMNWV